MNEETAIVNRVTIGEMVDAYHKADTMIHAAYTQLKEARELLEGAFGSHYSDFSTMPDHNHYTGELVVANNVMGRIKKNAWKSIIHRLGIRKLLSTQRAEKLDKMLEDEATMPEIEVATVLAHLQMLVDQRIDFMNEAVAEVYELLRPSAREERRGKYKTNDRNARYNIGPKVILSWKVESSFDHRYRFRVSYYSESGLLALDKVFHLLDGAGIPGGYRGELVDAINTSEDGTGQTEYFKFRACQNRNLHIEFRRMDLVAKLNQIAADPTQLKG